MNIILKNLYENYIKGTPAKSAVSGRTVFVCHLTNIVVQEIKLDSRVYITTNCLKHIYDKRPAEEFDFLIDYAHKVVKYPDLIYKNKTPNGVIFVL